MSLLDTIRRLLGVSGTKTMSRRLAIEMVMSGEDVTVWTEKLNGRNIKRDVYTVDGPTGNFPWDYKSKNMMVVWDNTKMGYRVIRLDKIYKIKAEDGIEYLVQ